MTKSTFKAFQNHLKLLNIPSTTQPHRFPLDLDRRIDLIFVGDSLVDSGLSTRVDRDLRNVGLWETIRKLDEEQAMKAQARLRHLKVVQEARRRRTHSIQNHAITRPWQYGMKGGNEEEEEIGECIQMERDSSDRRHSGYKRPWPIDNAGWSSDTTLKAATKEFTFPSILQKETTVLALTPSVPIKHDHPTSEVDKAISNPDKLFRQSGIRLPHPAIIKSTKIRIVLSDNKPNCTHVLYDKPALKLGSHLSSIKPIMNGVSPAVSGAIPSPTSLDQEEDHTRVSDVNPLDQLDNVDVDIDTSSPPPLTFLLEAISELKPADVGPEVEFENVELLTTIRSLIETDHHPAQDVSTENSVPSESRVSKGATKVATLIRVEPLRLTLGTPFDPRGLRFHLVPWLDLSTYDRLFNLIEQAGGILISDPLDAQIALLDQTPLCANLRKQFEEKYGASGLKIRLPSWFFVAIINRTAGSEIRVEQFDATFGGIKEGQRRFERLNNPKGDTLDEMQWMALRFLVEVSDFSAIGLRPCLTFQTHGGTIVDNA